jgi:hypothetical protein
MGDRSQVDGGGGFGSIGRTSTPDFFASIASAQRRVVVRHVSSNTWPTGGTMSSIVHVFHLTLGKIVKRGGGC